MSKTKMTTMDDLKAEIARNERDLTRKGCTNCGGSGWFNDSTEGGIPARCHCWANYAEKLNKALEDVRAKVPDEFKGYPLDFAVQRMAERLEACRQRLRDDEKEMKALRDTQDELANQIKMIRNFAHEVK